MSTLSYSLTDLSPEHQTHQHLRYVTSSSFGSDWNSVLHSHDCTELFYVTDGEGWLCTDETRIPLRKNTLVIVNPKVHHTERSSPEKKMHYIVLGIDNLQFCFHEGETFSPFQIFQLSSHREMILSLLHTILEELQKKQTSYEEVCQHYLSILLLQLHRITGKEFSFAPPPDIPYECQRAKAYIEEHFHEPVTLERIAAIVHWDKFYLSHQFSAAFSVSPINYLLQLRITHSKRLLCDTDYSITQIAESSGFSSQNYFTQAFKKLVGVSPRAYRQKHQK